MINFGEILRYSRPQDQEPEFIESHKNFYFITKSATGARPQLEKGINPMGIINSKSGQRRPAILTRSSPHKVGTKVTPWDDIYDLENGHIRYYGDNKNPEQQPEFSPGNKALIEEFKIHTNPDRKVRAMSTPIIFFKAVPFAGKSKGYIKFYGFGIIQRAELITQFDRASDKFFTNYAFDFTILEMLSENLSFNWQWINDRKNPDLNIEQTLKHAPRSWQTFVNQNHASVYHLKHRFATILTAKTTSQQPDPGAESDKVLKAIYQHYQTNKFHFEQLAEMVVARIFNYNGSKYIKGWITSRSNDGGADFIGRLDLGSEFSTVKIIVLGQAKCEKLTSPTGGNHIARTVARLKRGWIGAYVTTSYFSDNVQKEIIEDDYPILLVNGRRLAQEVILEMNALGITSINEYLNNLDSEFENRVQDRQPEEILLS